MRPKITTKPTTQQKYQCKLLGIDLTDVRAGLRSLKGKLSRRDCVPSSHAEHLRHFREWLRRLRSKHLGLDSVRRVPNWVLGLRYTEETGYPSPVKVGAVVNCDDLSSDLYRSYDWGKSRKHSPGESFASRWHVQTLDNGRTGWHKVTCRYLNYGLVLSPDGSQVWVSVPGSECVRPCYRGRFFATVDGVRRAYRVDKRIQPYSRRHPHRALSRALRQAGYPSARVVRHSKDQVAVAAGPDVHSPSGTLYVVVRLGAEGVDARWYHCDWDFRASRILDALQIVEERLAEQRKESERLHRIKSHQLLPRIWVGVDDSVTGGNCEPGTQAYAAQLCNLLGVGQGQLGGIRADELLSRRCDNLTIRAVYAAARRYGVSLGDCLG